MPIMHEDSKIPLLLYSRIRLYTAVLASGTAAIRTMHDPDGPIPAVYTTLINILTSVYGEYHSAAVYPTSDCQNGPARAGGALVE